MQLATPEFIGERLIAGMSGIVAAADAVLRKSAGKDEPPTQEAIEQWLADGDCPPEALEDVAHRLAALWGVHATSTGT